MNHRRHRPPKSSQEGNPKADHHGQDPKRQNRFDKRFDLSLLARDFNHHVVGAYVDNLPPEDIDQLFDSSA
jgi:hypothetical protein